MDSERGRGASDASAYGQNYEDSSQAVAQDEQDRLYSFGSASTAESSSVKPIKPGYCARAMLCGAALATLLVGGLVCAIGVASSFLEPAAWLPTMLGQQRTESLSLLSLSVGGVVAVLSLAGCFGACFYHRRGEFFLYLFGLLILLVLALAAAAVAVIWETNWAVEAWRSHDFRLAAAEQGTEPLAEAAVAALVTLHAELEALYAFCAPTNATAALASALETGQRPAWPAPPLHCTEGDESMTAFALWYAACPPHLPAAMAPDPGHNRPTYTTVPPTSPAATRVHATGSPPSASAPPLMVTPARRASARLLHA